MIQNIYSVEDKKANLLSGLWLSKNHETAIRAFRNAVNDGNSVMSKNPEDYQLVFLGTFEEETIGFRTNINNDDVVIDGAHLTVLVQALDLKEKK